MRLWLCVLSFMAASACGGLVASGLVRKAPDVDVVDRPVRVVTAPEIDPAACTGALGLLVIGTAMLTDRPGRSWPVETE